MNEINPKYKKYAVLFSLSIIIFAYLILFLKRVIYPDASFDTTNYHFFLGKNGFDNFPFAFKNSEFFPLGLHSFNPMVDIISYILYLLLGYRMGTVGSLFFSIGTACLGIIIFYKLGKEYLKKTWLLLAIPFFIVPLFMVHESLFQIGTYFTDNIFVFFLMSYLFILIKLFSGIEKNRSFLLLNLLAGILIGLIMSKLTNIIYIIPFFILNSYIVYKKYTKNNEKNFSKIFITLSLVILCALSFHYSEIISYIKSGNPVFPHYNGIFKSQYYPEKNWLFNFGPTSLQERIFYPYYAIKNPELLGEIKDMFPDIKLLVIFIFILFVYVFSLLSKKIRFNKNENLLLFIYFFSFFLWQIQFGYSRYGIFLEILGGIISILLLLKILNEKKITLLKIISVSFLFYMLFQSINIFSFNFKYDFSWRPTPSFKEWKDKFFQNELFAKYTKISEKKAKEIKNVDIIIQCVNPSSAYFSTIKVLRNKPMINIDKGSNGFLTSDLEYIEKRDCIIENFFNKQILAFAIVFNESGGPDGGVSKKKCMEIIKNENINSKKIKIEKEININNFINDKNFNLTIWTGKYYLKQN